jgi:DNA-directed RNA polymerase subunit RPC12/RpoP
MLMIRVNGQLLSPDRAIREGLPADTPLACPECESRDVAAKPALTMEQLGGESKAFTPRLQDRRCLRCGHRWQTVLPPAVYNDPLFIAGHGR